MDIKQFIANASNVGIDHNYNNMVHKESETLRNHVNGKIKDLYESLYPIDQLDFITITKDRSNDCMAMKKFINLYMYDKEDLQNVGFGGAMIRSVLDRNDIDMEKTIPIKYQYNVIGFGSKTVKDIFKLDQMISTSSAGGKSGFTVIIGQCLFEIDKKHYKSPSHAVLSRPFLDRIIMVSGTIYCSGTFLMELYRNLSLCDNMATDPVYGYPMDILEIYDHRSVQGNTIKDLIDRVDLIGLQNIDLTKYSNLMITYEDTILNNNTENKLDTELNVKSSQSTVQLGGSSKVTLLEYCMIRMMHRLHPIVLNHMRMLTLYMANFRYIRPAFFIARIIGFDQKYPSIYECLIENTGKKTQKKHNELNKNSESNNKVDKKTESNNKVDKKSESNNKVDKKTELISNPTDDMNNHFVEIDPKIDISGITNVYCIDMYCLNHIIKKDDDEMFIEYMAKIGFIKKLKTRSKTAEKIIGWLIEFKPMKIIQSLIDCMVMSDYNRLKVIMLTQQLDLLDNDTLDQYTNTLNTNTICPNEDEMNNDIDKQSQGRRISWQDETDDSDTGNHMLNILDLVIEKGCTRSFYFMIKIFPNILNGTERTPMMKKVGGSILHTIRSDCCADIVDLIGRVGHKNLLEEVDVNGKTPLMVFAEHGLMNCVDRMIDFGCQLDHTDVSGSNIIHLLCKNGHILILQKIIRSNMELIDSQNNAMETPAIIACQKSEEEIFYVLKGLGANLDLTDIHGNTAYHYICYNGICPGMIVINRKNKFGFKPSDYCTISPNFYYFQDQ